MKQIGAIETPDVGEVDLSGGRSPGRRRARNVFPEERLAVVEQDLDRGDRLEAETREDRLGHGPGLDDQRGRAPPDGVGVAGGDQSR